MPQREAAVSPTSQNSIQINPQVMDYMQETRMSENGNCKRSSLDHGRYMQYGDRDFSNQSVEYNNFCGRDDNITNSTMRERPRQNPLETTTSDTSMYDVHGHCDPQERIQVILPARRKASNREDAKIERFHNNCKDAFKYTNEMNTTQQNDLILPKCTHLRHSGEVGFPQFGYEGHINPILEVCISLLFWTKLIKMKHCQSWI